ncbi:hypothetical protein H0H93_008282 [Arthromyces matolae]|nr:hypothetical protein H0H93_008282 [Arthromyces matolae]
MGHTPLNSWFIPQFCIAWQHWATGRGYHGFITTFSLFLSTFSLPLTPRQSCADVTVFFARGTTESGTIGTVVGPPFEAALATALGGQSLNFVGIPYAASIAGFLEGGDPAGATTMANDVTECVFLPIVHVLPPANAYQEESWCSQNYEFAPRDKVNHLIRSNFLQSLATMADTTINSWLRIVRHPRICLYVHIR